MPPDEPVLQSYTPIVKEQVSSTNGSKPKTKRQQTLSVAVSGSSIQSGDIPYKFSTSPTAWKTLKTGDIFSRTADGKVLFIRTSKGTAHPLDKGIEMLRIPIDAQNLEVYRAWLNTL